jgi:tRNA(Leu) C34 or U34 (ribose-2'-O)-methylase TrmL
MATLEAWATVFLEEPADLKATIKSNVEHHLVKLTRDVKKARAFFNKEEYFAFGTELGTMLTIATAQ